MSISYVALDGKKFNFQVAKFIINKKGIEESYFVIFRMLYGLVDGEKKISVLMNSISMARLVYLEEKWALKKVFEEVCNLYIKKFSIEFKPRVNKLYDETCGHMNLYVEYLTGTPTEVSKILQKKKGYSDERMLKSAEIADVAFTDENSKIFNATSVKNSNKGLNYFTKARNSKMKLFQFDKSEIDYTFSISN